MVNNSAETAGREVLINIESLSVTYSLCNQALTLENDFASKLILDSGSDPVLHFSLPFIARSTRRRSRRPSLHLPSTSGPRLPDREAPPVPPSASAEAISTSAAILLRPEYLEAAVWRYTYRKGPAARCPRVTSPQRRTTAGFPSSLRPAQ